MLISAVLALPSAVVWMFITDRVTIDGFFLGFVVSLILLRVLAPQVGGPFRLRTLPSQLWAALTYIATLSRDIMLSSVDVARRVLDPALPLNPGIVTVATQDKDESDFAAAFSAHGITITPGELVVDFEGAHTMVVHCLDVESCSQNADRAQARRLALLRRMQGRG